MQNYATVRKIGKGSFGEVSLVRRKSDKLSFVLKRMKIGSVSKKEREMCHLEVKLLKRLSHPGIVTYTESFMHTNRRDTYMCVVMQYCEGGDLTGFLKQQRGRKMKERQILDLFVSVCLSLHFVHTREILHRDLKTQNIFIKNGQLKLGDFGISKVLGGAVDFAQTVIGTPYYMSPELVKNKPYDYKSDVWALGCVLYEMTTLKHAFDANSLNGLAGKIVRGKYPAIPYQYTQELRNLIAKMLHSTPSNRPSMSNILKLPFLRRSIRRYIRCVIQNYENGMCSSGSIDNFKEQLGNVGFINLFEEVEESLNSKKQPTELEKAQKQLQQEEKEKNKIEHVLKKLREERRWRIGQRRKKNFLINGKANIKSPQKKTPLPKRSERIKRKPGIPKQQEKIIKQRKKIKNAKQRYGRKPVAKASKPPPKQSSPQLRPSVRKPKVSDLMRQINENESSKREVENLNKWEAALKNNSPIKSKNNNGDISDSKNNKIENKHDVIENKKVVNRPTKSPPIGTHLHLDPEDQEALAELRRRRENMQRKLNRIQSPTRRLHSVHTDHSYAKDDEKHFREYDSPQKRMQMRKMEAADRRAEEIRLAIAANENNHSVARDRAQSMYHNHVPHSLVTEEPTEEEIDDEQEKEMKILAETLLKQSEHIEALRKSIATPNLQINTNSDSESENNVYDLLSCHKVEDSFFSENPPDNLEEEEEESDDVFVNVVPVGRLADRIRIIRERCIGGLGHEGFQVAYNIIKHSECGFGNEGFEHLHTQLKSVVPKHVTNRLIWNYGKLIDQLLFVEENADF